ncbi:MAG: lipocalin family protein [Chryseobacterium sp.]
MKKILFLAVSAAFVFSSCSNDDDDNNSINIVGVWRPSKTLKISGSNGNLISIETASTCNQKSTYDFNANNQLTSHIFENDANNCTDFGSQTAPYSYDMPNKKIVIDGDSYDVAKHTSNEIQIVVDYGQFNDDNIEDHMILLLTK